MTDKISTKKICMDAIKNFGSEGYTSVYNHLDNILVSPKSVEEGKRTREQYVRSYVLWGAELMGFKLEGIPVKERKVTEKVPAKIKSPKLVAAVVGSLEDKPKITNMTVEEIADKTAKRSKKKSKATGPAANSSATGVENFDPEEARAYVDAVTESMDNFIPPSETDHPASLSVDEVAALI